MRDRVMSYHPAAEHFARSSEPLDGGVALRGKHIILVTQGSYPHGMAEVRGVGRELVRLGVRTTVVCTGIRGALEPGVEPEILVTRSSTGGWLSRLRFTQEVAALLRRIEPDLVHVYAYRGCALLPYLASGSRHLFDLRTGNVSGRAWAPVADWLTGIESTSFDSRAVIASAVGRYVCHSRFADGVEFPLGCCSAGSNRARTRIDKRPPKTSAVTVGFVGGLGPVRKLERLIDAAAELRRRGAQAAWIIVGDGPARRELEARVGAAGLQAVVRFRGEVDCDQVWDHYADMDICIAYVPDAPHFHHQAPLKTIEAMACGLPVIASDTAGNRAFITHGRDGLVVADDPVDIASAIERLINDPVERQRLGEHAAATAAAYSWERIVQGAVLPEYARLLGIELPGAR